MHTPFRVTAARRLASRGSVLAAALLTLGACAMTSQGNPGEGIGFRQARFEEMSAMQTYRKCRDDALELDAQAAKSGDPARYAASAKLLEKCEAEIGPEATNVALEERMRAYALSVQNYVKAGDMERATANLQAFEKAFPGHDLYYHDGSSFTETMTALLGQRQKHEFGQLSMLNVNDGLKSEMRRVRYWKSH